MNDLPHITDEEMLKIMMEAVVKEDTVGLTTEEMRKKVTMHLMFEK